MAREHNIYRYVVHVKRWSYVPELNLIPYHRAKGTYFEVYQNSENGRWYWELYLSHSPQGAAARSGVELGYSTRQSAEGSITTAFKAMRDVVQDSNKAWK